jgi:hypothetical protein
MFRPGPQHQFLLAAPALQTVLQPTLHTARLFLQATSAQAEAAAAALPAQYHAHPVPHPVLPVRYPVHPVPALQAATAVEVHPVLPVDIAVAAATAAAVHPAAVADTAAVHPAVVEVVAANGGRTIRFYIKC